ncbi:MAG: hypothetical protein KJO19_10130 [Woeseia sp.]|nr:hypothetical protein [Woeseia sp.]
MRLPRIRTVLLVPLLLFVAVYVVAAITLALKEDAIAIHTGPVADYRTIAIFGASGTAGDGILKAALANPEIETIRVFTRRMTPRIEEGVSAGKVAVTLHTDYLDYSLIHDEISDVDAVFWAIGTSSIGVDEQTYGRIHVDFPVRFVTEWLSVSEKSNLVFHYISSSDISEDSSAMWAREKVRAEKALFAIAEGTALRVIAYRPDYIGPTREEAHLRQILAYGFFAPVGAAVKARQIGQAMFEATARGRSFDNGDKLGTRSIIRLSDAYEARQQIFEGN